MTRTPTPRSRSNVKAMLEGWVSRIDQLDEEIKGLNADKADVFKEAKKAGVDPNGLRAAVRFLRDPEAVMERNEATLKILVEMGHDPGKLGLPIRPGAAALAAIEGKAEGVDEVVPRAHAHVRAHEAGE